VPLKDGGVIGDVIICSFHLGTNMGKLGAAVQNNIVFFLKLPCAAPNSMYPLPYYYATQQGKGTLAQQLRLGIETYTAQFKTG
jgi:hypothetical protein